MFAKAVADRVTAAERNNGGDFAFLAICVVTPNMTKKALITGISGVLRAARQGDGHMVVWWQ